MLLLIACTLGHTLTVVYCWENIKNLSVMASSIDNTIATKMDDFMYKMRDAKKVSDNKEVQDLTMKWKEGELNRPTLESETYNNKTLSSLLLDKYH